MGSNVELISEPDYVLEVSHLLKLKLSSVKNVLKLVAEGGTVPFIARYRKEMTGNLDEVVIREILDCRKRIENLFSAKRSALNSIFEQGKLTDELKKSILDCESLTEVADVYEPFKRKRKTKADVAIENGFLPVAELILAQKDVVIDGNLLSKFSREEVVFGACDIVSQKIVDDVDCRKYVRHFFSSFGVVESSLVSEKKLLDLPETSKKQVYKFEIYSSFIGDVRKIREYQVLALNRGEDLGILKVEIASDDDCFDGLCQEVIVFDRNVELLKGCVKSAYKKIFSSIEREIRKELTEFAHLKAISTFSENLYKLLMTKPQYGKRVLAIDPGFRTGCKVCVLDENGSPVEFSKIFIDKEKVAFEIVERLISQFLIDVIVIGNGTASNEVYDLLASRFELPFVVVNESGASVYSASEVAKKEFPDLDLTDRGTVSIGRRFVDPLSELVKIPVESIGVGMYQHDVSQKLLAEKLEITVSDVVNLVGINVNTASAFVLKFISGLTARSAQKVFDGRPFSSRAGLKKVLSVKAFEQAAGFLRVNESSEELDRTAIHPEQYEVARFIFKNGITDFGASEARLKEIYSRIDVHTFEFILEAKRLAGQDLRKFDAVLKIKKTLTFDDVKVGDVLEGVVRNIMQFGAFVDVGLKSDGLVHISEVANKFVSDVSAELSVGEVVRVRVLSMDEKTGKMNLSIKQVEEN